MTSRTRSVIAEEMTEKVRLEIVSIITTTKAMLAEQEDFLSRWTTVGNLLAEKNRLERSPSFDNWKRVLEIQPQLDAFSQSMMSNSDVLERINVWKIVQKFAQHPEAVSCVSVDLSNDETVFEFNPKPKAATAADEGPQSSSTAPLAK